MSRREQRMTLSVMQKYERAASQDGTQPPYYPTRNQRIGVDWFAVSIDVENCRLICLFGGRQLPQTSCPLCESVGADVCPMCLGHLRKKPLDLPIAVGARSIRQQPKRITGVAA